MNFIKICMSSWMHKVTLLKSKLEESFCHFFTHSLRFDNLSLKTSFSRVASDECDFWQAFQFAEEIYVFLGKTQTLEVASWIGPESAILNQAKYRKYSKDEKMNLNGIV